MIGGVIGGVIGGKTRAVAMKELRQILRDRRTLLILLFVPAFFLLVYGYALNFDIRNIRLGVQDNDRSSVSRELVSAFLNSGYFDLVADVQSPAEIDRLIDRGDARAVLVIPARFGADARAGRTTKVQLIINGDNANSATTVVGYALSLVGALSARYEIEARLGAPTGPRLSIEPRVWYNPELRSALFLVPGLIAYIAMLTAVVSTSLSVVREKEVGTMEQVRMAPLGTVPYVVGKTLPYFFISLASATIIVLVAMLLFDLPMRGSWLALIAAVSLFLVGALAFGLLISTVAETQQVAFQLALLTSYLPTLMLSGFIFPISSMPAFLQVVTYAVPARYFLVVLRGIVLKGVGLGTFWRELGALSMFAVVILGLASLRLREAVVMSSSFLRLRHVIRKEFLELRRDPRLFGLVIIAPILQLVMLGYAASTDVRNIPLVIVDQDHTAESRELVSRFASSSNFVIVGALTTSAGIDAYLDEGRAWMAMVIPSDYGRQVRGGRPATVQVVADGTDANSTNVALGYAGRLVAGYARELVAASGGGVAEPLIGAEIRVWFNPQLESRHFMIPGILALVLLVVTTNLSSMAIVREKELGTLEQLNVTPIARWELIAGKLSPYALLGMVDVLIVLAVAIGWFEVPLRGSLGLLLLMCLVYLMTTLGLGLFVSTISATQQQAMMTASFFFLIPMVFLSGFVFPIENMPAVIQPFTYLIPLRYFLEILRGIFLKGVGLEILWKDALLLFAWGVGILTLATIRSSKRLA